MQQVQQNYNKNKDKIKQNRKEYYHGKKIDQLMEKIKQETQPIKIFIISANIEEIIDKKFITN